MNKRKGGPGRPRTMSEFLLSRGSAAGHSSSSSQSSQATSVAASVPLSNLAIAIGKTDRASAHSEAQTTSVHLKESIGDGVIIVSPNKSIGDGVIIVSPNKDDEDAEETSTEGDDEEATE